MLLLVLLGIVSSFAEAIGVSLGLLLVYLVLNRFDLLIATGGVLSFILRFTMHRVHNSTGAMVCIITLVAVRVVAMYAYGKVGSLMGETMSQTIQNQIHKFYLRMPYASFRQQSEGKLMNILGREAWFVADAYMSLIRIYINCIAVLILALFMFALSWRLTLCTLLATLLVYIAFSILSARAQEVGRELRRVWQNLWDHMMVTLEGMRSIRAFGQEEVIQRRFEGITGEAKVAGVASKKVQSLLDPLAEVGLLCILGAVVSAARWLRVDFAIVLALIALLGRIEPHLREFERSRLFLAEKEPQLSSLRSMLESNDRESFSQGEIAINKMHHEIRFEAVSFRYQDDDLPALHDVTFTIPAGKTTALIGPSGSGKSTIVNLLLRLHEPSTGEVTVDKAALLNLRRADWLELVALAGQDVDLVEGTVKDNIRLANVHATDQQITCALNIVGATELVDSLPHGTDSWIGPHATRLSGGQRQRIGLARAVLHDPQFLILDEAMNAMDMALERRVREALDNRFKGRTILLITHRLDTVQNADHVICLEQGRVVAEGKPLEVLEVAGRALPGSERVIA